MQDDIEVKQLNIQLDILLKQLTKTLDLLEQILLQFKTRGDRDGHRDSTTTTSTTK